MQITLQAGAHAPRAARRELRRMRKRLGRRYDDSLLVVSELVTNSVVHGPDGSTINVDVSVEGNTIRFAVTDQGGGFDGEWPQSSGRGLRIVETLAVDWGIEQTPNTTVWAELER
jgi:anti-sigma regulatory factor (Ser/Thr protein kinase)